MNRNEEWNAKVNEAREAYRNSRPRHGWRAFEPLMPQAWLWPAPLALIID
jgi:hypothetical protein